MNDFNNVFKAAEVAIFIIVSFFTAWRRTIRLRQFESEVRDMGLTILRIGPTQEHTPNTTLQIINANPNEPIYIPEIVRGQLSEESQQERQEEALGEGSNQDQRYPSSAQRDLNEAGPSQRPSMMASRIPNQINVSWDQRPLTSSSTIERAQEMESKSYQMSISNPRSPSQRSPKRKIYVLLEYRLSAASSEYYLFEVKEGCSKRLKLSNYNNVYVFVRVQKDDTSLKEEQTFVAVIDRLQENYSTVTIRPRDKGDDSLDRSQASMMYLRLIKQGEGVVSFEEESQSDITVINEQSDQGASSLSSGSSQTGDSLEGSQAKAPPSGSMHRFVLPENQESCAAHQDFFSAPHSSHSIGSNPSEIIQVAIVGCSEKNFGTASFVLSWSFSASLIICSIVILSNHAFVLFCKVRNRAEVGLPILDSLWFSPSKEDIGLTRNNQRYSFLEATGYHDSWWIRFQKIVFVGCKIVILSVAFVFVARGQAKAVGSSIGSSSQSAVVHSDESAGKVKSKADLLGLGGVFKASQGLQSRVTTDSKEKTEQKKKEEQEKNENERKKFEERENQTNAKIRKLPTDTHFNLRGGIQTANFNRDTITNAISRDNLGHYTRFSAYVDGSGKNEEVWQPNLQLSFYASSLIGSRSEPNRFDTEANFFGEVGMTGHLLSWKVKEESQAEKQSYIDEKEIKCKSVAGPPVSFVVRAQKPLMNVFDSSNTAYVAAELRAESVVNEDNRNISLRWNFFGGIAAPIFPKLIESPNMDSRMSAYDRGIALDRQARPLNVFVGG